MIEIRRGNIRDHKAQNGKSEAKEDQQVVLFFFVFLFFFFWCVCALEEDIFIIASVHVHFVRLKLYQEQTATKISKRSYLFPRGPYVRRNKVIEDKCGLSLELVY